MSSREQDQGINPERIEKSLGVPLLRAGPLRSNVSAHPALAAIITSRSARSAHHQAPCCSDKGEFPTSNQTTTGTLVASYRYPQHPPYTVSIQSRLSSPTNPHNRPDAPPPARFQHEAAIDAVRLVKITYLGLTAPDYPPINALPTSQRITGPNSTNHGKRRLGPLQPHQS